MGEKRTESDLADRMANVLEVCSEKQFKQVFLTSVGLLLHIHPSSDDIEWDELSEREKYEPADTN